jgi:hypothetical protein
VCVHADAEVVAEIDVIAHEFDLVGKHVRRGHLYRGRQIDDDGLALVRAPHGGNGVDHVNSVIQFGAGETFRRVLEHPFRFRMRERMLLHAFGAAHGNGFYAVAIGTEYLLALHGGGGVVHVHHGTASALERLVGAGNEFGTGLGEHLNGDVGRYAVLLDELTTEIEVRLAGGGKADLDFLEADLHEQVKKTLLLRKGHGFGQRLVAIAQVDRTPHGCLCDHAVGPAPLGAADGGEGAVFAVVKAHDGSCGRIASPG